MASVHPYTRHLLNDEIHPLYLVLKLQLYPAPVLPLSPSEGSREVVPGVCLRVCTYMWLMPGPGSVQDPPGLRDRRTLTDAFRLTQSQ